MFHLLLAMARHCFLRGFYLRTRYEFPLSLSCLLVQPIITCHFSPYVIPTIYSYLSLPKIGDFRLMPAGVWQRVVFSVVAAISEEHVALIFRLGFRKCVTVLILLDNRHRISSNLKWRKFIATFPVNHTVQRHFLVRKFTLCVFPNFCYRKMWRGEIRSMAGTRNLKSDGTKDSEVTGLECFNSHRVGKWRKTNKVKITREEE
jgi:hypothetical protein